MVSDQGPQFISEVWTHLCQILQINVKLSTAFHPESDRQSEIANSEMERYLCTFVNYQQDDWTDWLPLCEFAANANESVSTYTTLFFVNYSFQP